jgi:hypothetical protein
MSQSGSGTPRHSLKAIARFAGFFWALVFFFGVYALKVGPAAGSAFKLANMTATVCYAVATILIYHLLKSVNQPISMIGAMFSLVGCAISLLGIASSLGVRDLVFFGFHCLFVGYLILRSTLIPRFIGAFMMLAGIGWLTFAWNPLARALAPYNFIPGMVGEGLLILWLLIFGVRQPPMHAVAQGKGPV